MSQSFSTIGPGNLQLSPCRVTYKGVDLGATLGNVSLKIEEALSDMKSDQLGSTVIDKIVSGYKATIETELAEVQLKDNWKVVFPAHKLVESGGQKLILFDSQVGQSLLSLAGQMILHPLDKLDSDKSGDVLVYNAVCEGKADYTFSPHDQIKMKCVFHVLPDFTTTPPRFLIFGDPTIGATNASAAAAVAATGNTGNGTVGSLAAHNDDTKTEVITMTALTSTKFQVSGSLSGQLGVATVGQAFTSSVIDFTITAGGTGFVANDSFTIATTASNYS